MNRKENDVEPRGRSTDASLPRARTLSTRDRALERARRNLYLPSIRRERHVARWIDALGAKSHGGRARRRRLGRRRARAGETTRAAVAQTTTRKARRSARISRVPATEVSVRVGGVRRGVRVLGVGGNARARAPGSRTRGYDEERARGEATEEARDETGE